MTKADEMIARDIIETSNRELAETMRLNSGGESIAKCGALQRANREERVWQVAGKVDGVEVFTRDPTNAVGGILKMATGVLSGFSCARSRPRH